MSPLVDGSGRMVLPGERQEAMTEPKPRYSVGGEENAAAGARPATSTASDPDGPSPPAVPQSAPQVVWKAQGSCDVCDDLVERIELSEPWDLGRAPCALIETGEDTDGPYFDGDSLSPLGLLLQSLGLAALLLAGGLIYFALGGSW